MSTTWSWPHTPSRNCATASDQDPGGPQPARVGSHPDQHLFSLPEGARADFCLCARSWLFLGAAQTPCLPEKSIQPSTKQCPDLGWNEPTDAVQSDRLTGEITLSARHTPPDFRYSCDGGGVMKGSKGVKAVDGPNSTAVTMGPINLGRYQPLSCQAPLGSVRLLRSLVPQTQPNGHAHLR